MDVIKRDEFNPVKLFAGDFPRVIRPITIVAGSGILVEGTVIGRISSSGNYGVYDDGGADGLDTARAILSNNIDATTEDIKCNAYFAGEFNEEALTGFTEAARLDFLGTPIFLGKIG